MLYLQDYFGFLIAILACMIFSAVASAKVNRAFSKYDKCRNRHGYTGFDAAAKLLRANQVNDIAIGRVGGKLSDHYHPTKKIVNLSASTYDSASVAAVAVAAHEIGHVMQKKNGYLFYRFRTALVPVVNIGSMLATPLVLIGILFDIFIAAANEETGFYIAMAGVVLYGGSLLFALITLPVEWNASRRAKKMLISEGILTEDEMEGADAVLSAAALTYLASLLTSLVYFLRFLFQVLLIFGKRDD